MPRQPQKSYWLATWWEDSIPEGMDPTTVYFENTDAITWTFGQMEEVERGRHWQFMVYFKDKKTLSQAKAFYSPSIHLEPTRSAAADEYVLKDDTKVEGTEFMFGTRPAKRNSKKDWADIRKKAKEGRMEEVEDDVYVRHYGTLRRIEKDFMQPAFRGEQEVNVFWGVTGAGKSHRAFEEAGSNFYVKNCNKWWDGYMGQENIILEEFDPKQVDIKMLLRWLDKYPLALENKGGYTVIKSKKWWITSNTDPTTWYPDSYDQGPALARRLTNVVEFTRPWAPEE